MSEVFPENQGAEVFVASGFSWRDKAVHRHVTLSNAEVLVPGDESLLAQVRRGLSVSLRGLSLSANWLVVGVLFVLPWRLLAYAVFWLARRLWGAAVPPRTTATTAPITAPGPTG